MEYYVWKVFRVGDLYLLYSVANKVKNLEIYNVNLSCPTDYYQPKCVRIKFSTFENLCRNGGSNGASMLTYVDRLLCF